MTAELVTYQPQSALTEQMDYARAVSTASMLPDNYRGKPADIMLAVGLGQSMGLSPAESLYRISVIKGKPTASAELVAANVRKAGHRLRVKVESGSATCTIVRADDPDFEFVVTRDAAWAQQMGLADQPNYRKQPDTMLSWRAITACARLACPEALYGVAYTPDEMTDGGEARPGLAPVAASAADRMASILHVEQVTDSPASAGVEGEAGEPEADDPAPQPPSGVEGITSAQLKNIGRLCTELGLTERAAALAYVKDVIGRDIASRSDLTKTEASDVIDAMAAEAERAAS